MKEIRKALKEVFDGTPLYGCYFHFIKNLWEKAKQLGLFKRDLRKTTFIIIFSMKMYPYLPEDEKQNFLGKMEKYAKNINNNKYFSFFNYFKKVLIKEEFVKFDKLNASEFNKRTNNICEWFHKKLNNIIDVYHPKLAYLIQKLKDFSIYSYNQYKIQKTLFKNEINSGFNIADDVFKFIKKF